MTEEKILMMQNGGMNIYTDDNSESHLYTEAKGVHVKDREFIRDSRKFQIRLDIVLPFILVPGCLWLAIFNPVTTVLSLGCVPLAFFSLDKLCNGSHGPARSRLRFFWTIVSALTVYLIMMIPVNILHRIFLWENMVLNTMIMFLIAACVTLRRRPGVCSRPRAFSGHGRQHRKSRSLSGRELSEVTARGSTYDAVDHVKDSVLESEPLSTPVHTSDRRSGMAQWCGVCLFVRPSRASHCLQCGYCVALREGHCTWLDACIGAGNARLAFVTAVGYIVTALYGANLAFTTVCQVDMYLNWFLLPHSCKLVYEETISAWIWVAAIYMVMSVFLVGLWLIRQCIFISQNMTKQEWRQARRERRTRCIFWLPGHQPNKGFVHNWINFLSNRDTSEGLDPIQAA